MVGMTRAVQRQPYPLRPRRWLTAWSLLAAIGAVTFVVLLLGVLGQGGLTRIDRPVTTFVVQHRAGWLTFLMSLVTWLGSSVILTPFWLLIGGFFLYWRRTWWPLALLGTAFAGAAGLFEIIKPVVGRLRPAAALQVGGPNTDWAFPSGHTTQSVAFYGMLATIVITWMEPRRPVPVALVAALIAVLVGASRVYLGVHWLTDVLGGFALGLTWLAIVIVVSRLFRESWRS